MMLARLLSKIYKKNGIVLIDSKGQKYICGQPDLNKPVTLKLLEKSLNWKLALNPDLNFAEAYMRGEIQIENASLLEFLNMTFENIGRGEINFSGYTIKKIFHLWRFLTNYNLPGRSKRNVRHHYDIGEELYDLFLDKKHRQYSCAYFTKNNESLEEAQQNKINHIIKKLNLKPEHKVLDIGCGWGGMAFEIAQQSQCEVTGISLSENQIKYCKEKAKELNLDNQVRFELLDYRSVNSKFDRYLQGIEQLTPSELSGYAIFNSEKGDCFHCHGTQLFMDNDFHNNGLDTEPFTDIGLANVTSIPSDYGKFKTPTLRNIEFTAPYMHDGRFSTLEEVVEHYNSGGIYSSTIDPNMKKVGIGLQLTEQEKADLVAYLKSLSDHNFISK